MILMCPPKYFDVSYIINPWMAGNVSQVNSSLAMEQWLELYRLIRESTPVVLMEPQLGLPDLVFTANAGLVYENKFIVSRFLNAERQGEEQHFIDFFAARGFNTAWMAMPFEGAGDALFNNDKSILWMGYGHRSHELCAEVVREHSRGFFRIVPLRLIDDRFYHLDTCFCTLSGGEVLYYPNAFDEESNRLIERFVSPHMRIQCPSESAFSFACNAVNVENVIILNYAEPALARDLTARGYRVIVANVSEFMKAGGAAKCLTLDIG